MLQHSVQCCIVIAVCGRLGDVGWCDTRLADECGRFVFIQGIGVVSFVIVDISARVGVVSVSDRLDRREYDECLHSGGE
jgi:hypothetical protein